MAEVIPFLIVTFIIASLLRISFSFYRLSVLFGLYIRSRLWARRASQNLTYKRAFTPRIFLGERVPVELEVQNRGFLPIPWVSVSELLPIRLAAPNIFRQVIWLPPKGKSHLNYVLSGYYRGYYPIGPLSLTTGDIWGMEQIDRREPRLDYLTVYPRIVPIERMSLLSKSPLGTLRSRELIYEDPARVMGVRDYVTGDPLRRIDWKSTARSQKLRVKLLEPAISVEVAIFLNLNLAEYAPSRAELATELGIVAAASIANHMVGLRQAVGLSTNGLDPITDRIQPITLLPRKERSHLMQILDVLARVQAVESSPFTQLLREETLGLGWGATIIAITSAEREDLLGALIPLRRAGFHIAVLCTDGRRPFGPAGKGAESLGFKVWQVQREDDLRVLE